jgi:hypothetical protein
MLGDEAPEHGGQMIGMQYSKELVQDNYRCSKDIAAMMSRGFRLPGYASIVVKVKVYVVA